MNGLSLSVADVARFWRKVQLAEPDACWPWLGWKNASGHPRFDAAGRKILAAHIALDLDGRPRPPGEANALHADGCEFDCCNAAHLRWGAAVERVARRDRLGHRVPDCGEAHSNAKLTEDAVRTARASPLAQRKVAALIGCSQVWVGQIRRRKAWAHLD